MVNLDEIEYDQALHLLELARQALEEAADPAVEDHHPRIYSLLNNRNCYRCSKLLLRGNLAYWVGTGMYWCGCSDMLPNPPITTALAEFIEINTQLRALLEGRS